MDFERQSGVFLHVTSLPGPDGVGTLGEPARTFVDWLADAGQSLWQVCPLGPTSSAFANSPYQTHSAFAGNPLLIDCDELRAAGWLTDDDLNDRPDFDDHWVDYDAAGSFKRSALRTAFERFRETASDDERDALDAFVADNEDWLADYALFRALKRHFDQAGWTDWPDDVRQRDPETLARYREELADEIHYREFCQWVFERQWQALREYANGHDVAIVGDMPIYVGLDSADAWANPALFDLDENNEPAAVAGMPTNPDGEGGQRWGNPLYDWAAMAADDYDWWVARLEHLRSRVDVARVDHFKGFEEFWAIPAEADATDGEWRQGPGRDLFETLEAELGPLPLVVEDLGGVTPALRQLRDDLGLPGMKVTVFADWCTEDHEYMPHTYPENSVAYTSTHDTNTLVGWYASTSDRQRNCLHFYLDSDGTEVHWDLLDRVWAADSVFAIAPIQDLLGLGADTRFNTPGTQDGNWSWRVTRAGLDADVAERLAGLTAHHDRE